ncbi:MAG: UDP-N-acetylmuramate dehydrogenase [Lactobacillus sp.]
MALLKLKQTGIDIREAFPLAQVTFTETGGPAEYAAFPKNITELKQLLAAAAQDQLPLTVIGNASNLIIKDGGIAGLVLILTKMAAIKVAGPRVTAQAGAKIIDTAFTAAEHGLSKLEFAAGIPGSIGGGVFMNAGAYGSEMQDCLEAVTVITQAGKLKVYDNHDMQFSYRHSLVQDTKEIVVAATFLLVPGDKARILADMTYLNALRKYKQPLEYPSCGSVFKRPTGHFVGPMIISAGLQGKQVGGAQDSMKHAGFIVNKGGATATDYLRLILLIQQTIAQKYHLSLQTEVRIIGQDKGKE